LRREMDWAASVGGEDSEIVTPKTLYEPAYNVARKPRTAVSHTPSTAAKKSLTVTASFGLCGLDQVPTDEPRLADRMLKIADAALYRSKETGRNRVTATNLGNAPGPGGGRS